MFQEVLWPYTMVSVVQKVVYDGYVTLAWGHMHWSSQKCLEVMIIRVFHCPKCCLPALYFLTLLTDQHQNFIKWAILGSTLQDLHRPFNMWFDVSLKVGWPPSSKFCKLHPKVHTCWSFGANHSTGSRDNFLRLFFKRCALLHRPCQ